MWSECHSFLDGYLPLLGIWYRYFCLWGGQIAGFFCIQLFDSPPISSALSFFLVSQSRTDKSGTQYKQQMGQSPVFVSMPPIVIKGEETKHEPQTPPFLYSWLTTETHTTQGCCCFVKPTLEYRRSKWDPLSYRPEKQQHTYSCSSGFLGEERWEEKWEGQVLTCSRNRGWRRFTGTLTRQGGKREGTNECISKCRAASAKSKSISKILWRKCVGKNH